MNDTTEASIVVERTYKATAQELWDLWTHEGRFRILVGAGGFRADVHAMDARQGGAFHYDMVAKHAGDGRSHEADGQPGLARDARHLHRVHAS